MKKYLVIFFAIVASACATSHKPVNESTDNRNPAQISGQVIALESSNVCNRIDAISSAENGRWNNAYSVTWDDVMINTLKSQGLIADVTVYTEDSRKNRVSLDLGQTGVALADKMDSNTYFSRYNLMNNKDQAIGMLIVSYGAKDTVAASEKTVRKAKSIIVFMGIPSASVNTIVCKHARTATDISTVGCTVIDETTVLSKKAAPLCFDTTRAIVSYQNSF